MLRYTSQDRQLDSLFSVSKVVIWRIMNDASKKTNRGSKRVIQPSLKDIKSHIRRWP